MKKLIGASALILGLAMASCGGNGAQTRIEGGFDSLFTDAQADTLVMSTAKVGGWEIGNMLGNAMEADPSFSKEAFLKGVKYTLDADTSSSFAFGMQIGNNINGTLKYWSEAGLVINREAFFKQFSGAVMQDSISFEEKAFTSSLNQRMASEFREALAKYEDYKIEASERSLSNIKLGEQYIDSIAKANPNVKVAASGLAYEILDPGSDKKPSADDQVKIQYTGSTTYGDVFDKADEVSARLVPMRLRNEGLQQGLQMIGEGGEAIFYIPGKLAYGTNRNNRFGLGPNQLVIYKVKLDQVQTKEDAAAEKK